MAPFVGDRHPVSGIAAAAAVLGQVTDQAVHRIEVGAVPDEAAVLAGNDEAGAPELLQVERERRRRNVEPCRDLPGGQPLGRMLDQKPVDPETRVLRERGEGERDT